MRRGMNEVSNQPLRRSAPSRTPDHAGAQHQLGLQGPQERGDAFGVALAAGDARLVIPDQPSRYPPQPLDQLSRARQQGLGLRVGIICPVTNREWVAVTTNTGNGFTVPSSSRILRGGNHKSHYAASPGAQTSRSAGVTGRSSSAAASRSPEPSVRSSPVTTRPAPSPACLGSVPTRTVPAARTQCVRERCRPRRPLMPRRRHRTHGLDHRRPQDPQPAIRAVGTPSAASLLISTQSSRVITPQSSTAHFLPPKRPVFERRRQESIELPSRRAESNSSDWRRYWPLGLPSAERDRPPQRSGYLLTRRSSRVPPT